MAAHSVPGGSSKGASGRYHSVAFANAAEILGLNAQRGLATREASEAKFVLAYSHITLDDPAPWKAVIHRLDRVLAAWEKEIDKQPHQSMTRPAAGGPVSMVCECTPKTLPQSRDRQRWPRLIRVSEGIASDGQIICG